MISGFRREEDEIRAVPGYYTADVSGQSVGPIIKGNGRWDR